MVGTVMRKTDPRIELPCKITTGHNTDTNVGSEFSGFVYQSKLHKYLIINEHSVQYIINNRLIVFVHHNAVCISMEMDLNISRMITDPVHDLAIIYDETFENVLNSTNYICGVQHATIIKDLSHQLGVCESLWVNNRISTFSYSSKYGNMFPYESHGQQCDPILNGHDDITCYMNVSKSHSGAPVFMTFGRIHKNVLKHYTIFLGIIKPVLNCAQTGNKKTENSTCVCTITLAIHLFNLGEKMDLVTST
jgi:hypothetical protein